MTFNTRRTQPGFTLIELLAVMGLMAVIIGLSFPILRKLGEFSQGAAGVNSVSVAVNAARIYSQRISGTAITDPPGFPSGTLQYEGTAVIFTPSGEIRLVINDRPAQYARYEAPPHDPLQIDPDTSTPPDVAFAYNDLGGVDYIKMPRGSGIVGVRRTSSGIELLPPPFAIRFDRGGHLAIAADPDDDVIYYDSDNNGTNRYSTAGRSSIVDYTPDDWDARIKSSMKPVGIENPRYELPFDRIEVVASVLLYDARAFRGLGGQWPNTPPKVDEYTTGNPYSTPEEYLLDRDKNGELINSTAIFFSRHSGFALPRE